MKAYAINPVRSGRLFSGSLAAATMLAALALSPAMVQAGSVDQAAAAAKTASVQQGKININTASAAVLAQLHGIGMAKAQAIVDYRDRFGKFRSAEDLLAVEGVGKATLAKNRSRISL